MYVLVCIDTLRIRSNLMCSIYVNEIEYIQTLEICDVIRVAIANTSAIV